MNEQDPGQFAFNIHAELYQNDFGDLAIRFEGDRVYSGMQEDGRFQVDARQVIQGGSAPAGWQEISPRHLLYGRNWQCIARLGFIDGDFNRPAVEFEIESERISPQGKEYLADLLR
ncbi:MAG: hypothetical protein WDA20_08285 [Desulfuromonadales bacterium]|jgi:hypothetical protein